MFASRVIRGVRAEGGSPAWLRERLRRVGINSISAVVDVTNYVMMELGQPMHAYDLARLSGAITVRVAAGGRAMTLLDDKEYVLDPEFLVIADGSGAVGLAGIMGGREHRHLAMRPPTCCSRRAFHADMPSPAGRGAWAVHRCRAALRARRRSRPAGARDRAGRPHCSRDRGRRGRARCR